MQLCVAGHLIDKAKPTTSVSGGRWPKEVPDGVEIFGKRLYGLIRHPEASEVDAPFSKLEFVGVEDDACLPDAGKEVGDPPPVLFQVAVVVDGIVHAALLALHLWKDGVESAVVAITGWQEALWGS